jgi:hypothetical protein
VSIADEIQKLEELRRGGSLTDEEFAQAKAKVLAGADSSTGEEVGQQLSDHLAEVRYQNELARVDREWEMERQKYFITDRYGRRHIPTSGMGVATAVIGGIFGVFWTIMAIAITASGPSDGPFGIAKVVMPLFGVVFIVAAIGYGIHCYSRAQQYEKALAAYQARRRAITSGPKSV